MSNKSDSKKDLKQGELDQEKPPVQPPETEEPEQPQAPAESVRNPLILTFSEHRALTAADRETFRAAGGTVTNDPEPTA